MPPQASWARLRQAAPLSPRCDIDIKERFGYRGCTVPKNCHRCAIQARLDRSKVVVGHGDPRRLKLENDVQRVDNTLEVLLVDC